jgi:hypothetical protein
VDRGATSWRAVLAVLGLLVLVIAITMCATRPTPNPTSVTECKEQHGEITVTPQGAMLCWLDKGEDQEPVTIPGGLPTSEPEVEPPTSPPPDRP